MATYRTVRPRKTLGVGIVVLSVGVMAGGAGCGLEPCDIFNCETLPFMEEFINDLGAAFADEADEDMHDDEGAHDEADVLDDDGAHDDEDQLEDDGHDDADVGDDHSEAAL